MTGKTMTSSAIALFTEEDRPLCKRCEDKKAVLSKGKLAYKGFCSGCYQADKTERRMAEGYDDPKPAAVRAKPLPRKASAESEEPTGSTGKGKRKKVPGGWGTPKPTPWPTPDDEVHSLAHLTGWCMTGHHSNLTTEDMFPDGLTGLLHGTLPVTCPYVIWMVITAEWVSCPCSCHNGDTPGA